MFRYQNLHRDSGVTHYEVLEHGIRVRFVNGAVYTYTNDVTGSGHVDEMKRRAAAGRGLSTYISQHVADRYAAKE